MAVNYDKEVLDALEHVRARSTEPPPPLGRRLVKERLAGPRNGEWVLSEEGRRILEKLEAARLAAEGKQKP